MKKSVFLGEMPVWFLGPNLTSKVAYNHLTDSCLIAENASNNLFFCDKFFAVHYSGTDGQDFHD